MTYRNKDVIKDATAGMDKALRWIFIPVLIQFLLYYSYPYIYGVIEGSILKGVFTFIVALGLLMLLVVEALAGIKAWEHWQCIKRYRMV
ncbi:MAG TPA: hypothetical protein DCL21_03420 [Alphaproteobacteria bacterium]|nr:hypothetical protein [Alphaproteobacteria bacterium]